MTDGATGKTKADEKQVSMVAQSSAEERELRLGP